MAFPNLTQGGAGNTAPGADAETAVQSDTTDLASTASGGVASFPYCYRAIYVGGAGDVKIKTLKGSTVTFTAVPAGTLLPVAALRVFTTGTSATSLTGIL